MEKPVSLNDNGRNIDNIKKIFFYWTCPLLEFFWLSFFGNILNNVNESTIENLFVNLTNRKSDHLKFN